MLYFHGRAKAMQSLIGEKGIPARAMKYRDHIFARIAGVPLGARPLWRSRCPLRDRLIGCHGEDALCVPVKRLEWLLSDWNAVAMVPACRMV
jgi:hypothetical protein